jgi:hypothetical protein
MDKFASFNNNDICPFSSLSPWRGTKLSKKYFRWGDKSRLYVTRSKNCVRRHLTSWDLQYEIFCKLPFCASRDLIVLLDFWKICIPLTLNLSVIILNSIIVLDKLTVITISTFLYDPGDRYTVDHRPSLSPNHEPVEPTQHPQTIFL